MYQPNLPTFLVFSFLLYAVIAAGQSKTVEVINVEYGEIVDQLPYGKNFRFKGGTLDKLQQRSDIVKVKVYELSKKEHEDYIECEKSTENKNCIGDKIPFYQNYWVNPTEDTADSFDILINKPLHFSRKYLFVFSYYHHISLTKEKILSRLSVLTEDYAANNNLNVNNINTRVVDAIITTFKDNAIGTDDGLYQVHPEENNPVINGHKLNLKEVTLPDWLTNTDKDGLIHNLVTKIVASSAKKAVDQDLGRIKIHLADTYGSNQYETNRKLNTIQKFLTRDSIIDRVKGLIDDLSIVENSTYKEYIVERVRSVQAFLNTQNTGKNSIDEDVESLLRLLYKVEADLPSDSLKNFLSDVSVDVSDYVERKKESDDFKKNIAEAISTIEGVVDTIDDIYTLTGTSIRVYEFPNVKNLDSDKVKIDILTLGAGGTWLNAGKKNAEWRPLGYVAIRYYFYQVDKGLKNQSFYAGENWYFKTSAFFGFIPKSTLSYQGEDLGKSVFGLQPVAGFGFDLNRFFTLDLGAVAFTQSNPHPFIDKQPTRIAPFISLNLGFDLFNRIRSGITTDPYNVKP